MVATWLTELYLDQINRALLDAHAGTGAGDAPDGGAGAVAALEQQLQVGRLSRDVFSTGSVESCTGHVP